MGFGYIEFWVKIVNFSRISEYLWNVWGKETLQKSIELSVNKNKNPFGFIFIVKQSLL